MGTMTPINDYICIGTEAIILLDGNHTHRTDWFSPYPFAESSSMPMLASATR